MQRVVLTIADEVKMIEMLDKSVLYPVMAEKFGIGKSTARDMKNCKKILKSRKKTVFRHLKDLL